MMGAKKVRKNKRLSELESLFHIASLDVLTLFQFR